MLISQENYFACACAIIYTDVGSLCECSDLEIFYGTSYTDAILEEASEVCFRDVKRTKIDKDKCLLKCCEKAPTIAEVTTVTVSTILTLL